MTITLAIVNNKGGVGKTTTAVNLAAGLISAHRRVLLVDLDSQGSASLSLGVPRAELDPSVARSLFQREPVRSVIRKTSIEGLDLLTGSIELANADLVLSEVKGREERLKVCLKPVLPDYEFVIVDCPPSLALLPINALVAADAFLVPLTPHYLSLEGLVGLLDAVERVREGMGVKTPMLGLLLTMVDYRARVTGEIIKMIRNEYRRQVFKTEIRGSIRLTEAPSFGKTIFEHASRSPGAEAYRSLAGEVIHRCHKDLRKEVIR
jgi:chromosome partitioning protein